VVKNGGVTAFSNSFGARRLEPQLRPSGPSLDESLRVDEVAAERHARPVWYSGLL
jgi:hypothetical protein